MAPWVNPIDPAQELLIRLCPSTHPPLPGILPTPNYSKVIAQKLETILGFGVDL